MNYSLEKTAQMTPLTIDSTTAIFTAWNRAGITAKITALTTAWTTDWTTAWTTA